jgi:hypothetical protein
LAAGEIEEGKMVETTAQGNTHLLPDEGRAV